MKETKEKKTKGFLQNLFNPLKEKVEEKRQENKELKELEKKAFMTAEEELKKKQLDDKQEKAIQKGIEKANKKYNKKTETKSDDGSLKSNMSKAVDDMFAEPQQKHDIFNEENITTNNDDGDIFTSNQKASSKRNDIWEEEFGN